MEDKLNASVCGYQSSTTPCPIFIETGIKGVCSNAQLVSSTFGKLDNCTFASLCLCMFFRRGMSKEMKDPGGHIFTEREKGDRQGDWVSSRDREKVGVLRCLVFPWLFVIQWETSNMRGQGKSDHRVWSNWRPALRYSSRSSNSSRAIDRRVVDKWSHTHAHIMEINWGKFFCTHGNKLFLSH